MRARPGKGVEKSNFRYSKDPANLAHVGNDALLEAMRQIFLGCAALLRPGGIVAMTVRPWWHDGGLIDLPGALVRVGESAGLVLFERNVMLLAAIRDDGLIPRASFFALEQVRRARAAGVPRLVVGHEDLLVFRAGQTSVGSAELNESGRTDVRAQSARSASDENPPALRTAP